MFNNTNCGSSTLEKVDWKPIEENSPNNFRMSEFLTKNGRERGQSVKLDNNKNKNDKDHSNDDNDHSDHNNDDSDDSDDSNDDYDEEQENEFLKEKEENFIETKEVPLSEDIFKNIIKKLVDLKLLDGNKTYYEENKIKNNKKDKNSKNKEKNILKTEDEILVEHIINDIKSFNKGELRKWFIKETKKPELKIILMLILMSTDVFDIKIPSTEKKNLPSYLKDVNKKIIENKKIVSLSQKDYITIYVSSEKLYSRGKDYIYKEEQVDIKKEKNKNNTTKDTKFKEKYKLLLELFRNETDMYMIKKNISYITVYQKYNYINLKIDITKNKIENITFNQSQQEFTDFMANNLTTGTPFMLEYIAMMGEGKTTMVPWLVKFCETINRKYRLDKSSKYRVIYACNSKSMQTSVASLAYSCKLRFGLVVKTEKGLVLEKNFNCGYRKRRKGKKEAKPIGYKILIEAPDIMITSIEAVEELRKIDQNNLLKNTIIFYDELPQGMIYKNIRDDFNSIIKNPPEKCIIACGTLVSNDEFDIKNIWSNHYNDVVLSTIKSKSIKVPCLMVNNETKKVCLLWERCKTLYDYKKFMNTLKKSDAFYQRLIDINVVVHMVKTLSNSSLKIRNKILNLEYVEYMLRTNSDKGHQIVYELAIDILESLENCNDEELIIKFCTEPFYLYSFNEYIEVNQSSKALIFDENFDKFNEHNKVLNINFYSKNSVNSWNEIFNKIEENEKKNNKDISISNRQSVSEIQKIQKEAELKDNQVRVVWPELLKRKHPYKQINEIKTYYTTEEEKMGQYQGEVCIDPNSETEYNKDCLKDIDNVSTIYGKTKCAYGMNTGVTVVLLENSKHFEVELFSSNFNNWKYDKNSIKMFDIATIMQAMARTGRMNEECYGITFLSNDLVELMINNFYYNILTPDILFMKDLIEYNFRNKIIKENISYFEKKDIKEIIDQIEKDENCPQISKIIYQAEIIYKKELQNIENIKNIKFV